MSRPFSASNGSGSLERDLSNGSGPLERDLSNGSGSLERDPSDVSDHSGSERASSVGTTDVSNHEMVQREDLHKQTSWFFWVRVYTQFAAVSIITTNYQYFSSATWSDSPFAHLVWCLHPPLIIWLPLMYSYSKEPLFCIVVDITVVFCYYISAIRAGQCMADGKDVSMLCQNNVTYLISLITLSPTDLYQVAAPFCQCILVVLTHLGCKTKLFETLLAIIFPPGKENPPGKKNVNQ